MGSDGVVLGVLVGVDGVGVDGVGVDGVGVDGVGVDGVGVDGFWAKVFLLIKISLENLIISSGM